MPSINERGAAWLADKQTTQDSQTVTYYRGDDTVSLAATKCWDRQETDQEYGREEVTNCDWLIDASLIVIGGETVLPEKNDVIAEADGSRWQVLPISSEKHFKKLPGGKLRIHTKQIEDAA